MTKTSEATAADRIAGFLLGIGVGTAIGFFLKATEDDSKAPADRRLKPPSHGRSMTVAVPNRESDRAANGL